MASISAPSRVAFFSVTLALFSSEAHAQSPAGAEPVPPPPGAAPPPAAAPAAPAPAAAPSPAPAAAATTQATVGGSASVQAEPTTTLFLAPDKKNEEKEEPKSEPTS